MNPTRARIGDALILILLGCCMASHAATPATRETITTPPPGSPERGAILDALRAELTHLTGPARTRCARVRPTRRRTDADGRVGGTGAAPEWSHARGLSNRPVSAPP
ncbi:MAG: hypothetical protein KFB96_22935 [Thiocapsa sp.]|uniref:hypothetical protein n=1 Tax=Thiocapsa sp. TaxID=2024551 RepID=UPI001BCEBAA2|nr:hypothetical protein [Thiocapsa sp.]QVL48425.1 MAG: hypothetical protein KFB96_22935 [Thiocapsa sp.]